MEAAWVDGQALEHPFCEILRTSPVWSSPWSGSLELQRSLELRGGAWFPLIPVRGEQRTAKEEVGGERGRGFSLYGVRRRDEF